MIMGAAHETEKTYAKGLQRLAPSGTELGWTHRGSWPHPWVEHR